MTFMMKKSDKYITKFVYYISIYNRDSVVLEQR